jgi:formylglycine-generating enzyme required for sulfatase activity
LLDALAIDSAPNITVEELRPVGRVNVDPLWVAERPLLESDLGGEKQAPAMLTYKQAVAAVSGLHCRLPSEAEWEYFCRGGSNTLFAWGPSLPPERELDEWLQWDFPNGVPLRRNGFGLGGLFFGEWCADEYRPSHADTVPPQAGVFVVKGGGAQFHPWQDSGEWVFCLPAMRMPSSDLMDDKSCAVRPVLSAE